MKKFALVLAALSLPFAACLSQSAAAEELITPESDSAREEKPGPELPVSSFKEVWAYLLDGREETLKKDLPLTDVGYFGAEVDTYGKLISVPDRKRIAWFTGRVHLIAGCSGRALTHFAIAEGSRERKELIADLLAAAKDYDGLQIDFENVPPRDGPAFLSFLKELRAGLGDKMFTIALPARSSAIKDDVYDYRKIAPIVDRILVMAYDEHWSTSEPGPIASMDWCDRVARYSLIALGPEKLIMGLPFYGRSWGDYNPNRAFLFSTTERIKAENSVTEIRRESGIPTFTYKPPLTVTVYYEDEVSLSSRLALYKKLGVKKTGFWCLGQETPAVWPLIKVE